MGTSPDTSAKYNYVTGSLWECQWVVGPEFQGGQIPELTGRTQWRSGAPGSTSEREEQNWECQRQAWEQLGAQTTSTGAPVTSLGAPPITVEQSGRKNILFGNTADARRNHRYYLLFNDFQNSCIQLVFPSMYLCIKIATHLHTVYLDWLQAVLESNSRCAGSWQSSELIDTLEGGYCANFEMHLEAVMERIGRCIRRPWSSELTNALGGSNQASLEIHLEAIIVRTWRTWSSKCVDALGDHDRV